MPNKLLLPILDPSEAALTRPACLNMIEIGKAHVSLFTVGLCSIILFSLLAYCISSKHHLSLFSRTLLLRGHRELYL